MSASVLSFESRERVALGDTCSTNPVVEQGPWVDVDPEYMLERVGIFLDCPKTNQCGKASNVG